MIDAREAVQRATSEVVKLLGKTPPGLRLEEVDFTADEKDWLITLGYLEEEVDPNPSLISPLALRKKYERVFRVVKLNGDTGEFRSMKIRTP